MCKLTWNQTLIVSAAFLTGAGVLFVATGASAARSMPMSSTLSSKVVRESQRDVLDPVKASAIRDLRAAAGLDDDALAACNLTDAQLDDVLGGVRTWFDNNGTGWLQTVAESAEQRGLIQGAESAQSNGVDRASDRTRALNALYALQQTRAESLANLRSASLANLTDAHRALIESMQMHSNLALPYRALSLSNDQQTKLAAATRRLAQRSASAQSNDELSAIQGDFQSDRQDALGTDTMIVILNLQDYLPASSERVVNAVRRMLPEDTGDNQ